MAFSNNSIIIKIIESKIRNKKYIPDKLKFSIFYKNIFYFCNK